MAILREDRADDRIQVIFADSWLVVVTNAFAPAFGMAYLHIWHGSGSVIYL